MSEQAKILTEMQTLIMGILQSGSTTAEDADKMDELEDLLYKQNSFKRSEQNANICQGEEIATLFFKNKNEEAITKLHEYEITPEDFFGFVDYHYDDEHEDEELAEMFTDSFIVTVNKEYLSK